MFDLTFYPHIDPCSLFMETLKTEHILPLLLHLKPTAFSFRGTPDRLIMGSAPVPCWGLRPPTPMSARAVNARY